MLDLIVDSGMPLMNPDGSIMVIPMPVRRAVIVRVGSCWRIQEHEPGKLAETARDMIARETPADYEPNHDLWVPAISMMGQCPVFLEALAARSMLARQEPEGGTWAARYQSADSFYAEHAGVTPDAEAGAAHLKNHWDEAGSIIHPRNN